MNTIKDIALGVGTCVLIVVLAVLSNAALDVYKLRRDLQAAQSSDGAACVNAKGAWVNWPWANAPTLSPRCDEAAPEPGAKQ